MRVAMVQDDWWPCTGGGPVHVQELSVALTEMFDYEIDIYTRALRSDETSYTDHESYADGKVSVKRLRPCTEYWNATGRIASMATPVPRLLGKRYDVVHGHTFLPALPTRLAGLATDVATVFTVHGTALTSGVGHDTGALAGVKRRLERLFVLGFDYEGVISVNTEHLPLLERAHDRVAYIPNGVDLDRFAVDRERTSGRILFLGRLAPKKRVSDLIEAFAQVAPECPDSELVIVGVGPLKDDLERRVDRMDLNSRVRFEGRVADDAIPEYYASASVFVLPSVWEGHPLTLLEAWAAGTPVIATDVEGIAEFVTHEETGYLVPPESPDALASALRYALEHESRTRTWGERGRALAAEEFSWEGVARRTDELYREAVSKRKAGSSHEFSGRGDAGFPL
jgi:glycosyltransferase involved in cell wall biosynthesis